MTERIVNAKSGLSGLAVLMTVGMIMVGGGGGCSARNKDAPELYRVRGQIFMDGEPLPDARVIFTPKGGGRPVHATTGSSGRYDLKYSTNESGAPAGEYVVSIRTGLDPEEDPETGDESPAIPESVPSMYNVKSTLTAEVPNGDYDFHLESTPEPSESPRGSK